MAIREGSKVRLITGEVARVVEVLGGGAVYIIETQRPSNGFSVTIEHIYPRDIASVFVETEHPIASAM